MTAEDDQRLDALFTEPSDFYYNEAVITYSVDVTVTKRDDNVNRRDSISIKYCFERSEILRSPGRKVFDQVFLRLECANILNIGGYNA